MDSTNPQRDAPLPESRFSVVLVEPQHSGNVGHVARSMLNFGLGDLILVRAGEIDEMARSRAVHAQKVLNEARRFEDLADVKKEFEHLVGFAARISGLDKAHRRMSESLPDVARRLDDMGGGVALVFGREDFGLGNEDVEICDMLCTIPTSRSYRSMNLSHAVTVALYEMTSEARPKLPKVTMATPHEKDVLHAAWFQLTQELGFKPHRQRQSLQMFQRVTGRAGLTSWEYHRLMGVLSRSLKRMGSWPIRGVENLEAALGDDEDADSREE